MSRVLKQLERSQNEVSEPAPKPYLVKPPIARKSASSAPAFVLFFILLVAAGGAFFYWKTLPAQKNVAGTETNTSLAVPSGLTSDQVRENEDAIKLYYAGNLDEAFKHFSHLSKLNPKSAALLVNLGLIQRKRGALAEARKQNLAALHLNPKNATAHNNLGTLSADEKNWDEAIKMFTQSLKEDNQLLDAYLNLGNAYEQKADWANASQAYLAYVTNPAGDPAVKLLLKKRIPKLHALAEVPAGKKSP